MSDNAHGVSKDGMTAREAFVGLSAVAIIAGSSAAPSVLFVVRLFAGDHEVSRRRTRVHNPYAILGGFVRQPE